MSEPVFIAFASQKGGSGKSTLTALTASYLYYLQGVDVLVVDCDSRQYTQKDYRENDMTVINANTKLKRIYLNFYKTFKKKPYKIIYTDPGQAIAEARGYLSEHPEIKVVFFDITGTINDTAIVELISKMHHLFVPITTDTGDMKSSLRFATKVSTGMMTAGAEIRSLNLIWNRIPGREKLRICTLIDEYMDELGLTSLETVMSNSTKYFKDGSASSTIFRSTVLPPDKQLLKGSNLPALVKEIRAKTGV